LEQCFRESPYQNIRALAKNPSASVPRIFTSPSGLSLGVTTVGGLASYHQTQVKQNKLLYVTDGAFLAFMQKWDRILGRDINFSVRILPKHLNATHKKHQAGVNDFKNDPSIKNRFVINL
jgi:hypothetical protein